MNWGKGLVIGMLAFVGFIVTLSGFMFAQPADDYDHQYYEKGITFDSEYKRQKQVEIDKVRPVITQLNGTISVAFLQPATGKVRFVSPLGQLNDKSYAISNSRLLTVAAGCIPTGRREVVAEWSSNGKLYLYRQDIYIK